MKRDKCVNWPFTNGFMILSMLDSNDNKWIQYAINEYDKWTNLDGFYEWYDIVDGNGYGSTNQVWSASLYLRVNEVINKIKSSVIASKK